jgi:hypothetical protein
LKAKSQSHIVCPQTFCLSTAQVSNKNPRTKTLQHRPHQTIRRRRTPLLHRLPNRRGPLRLQLASQWRVLPGRHLLPPLQLRRLPHRLPCPRHHTPLQHHLKTMVGSSRLWRKAKPRGPRRRRLRFLTIDRQRPLLPTRRPRNKHLRLRDKHERHDNLRVFVP